MKNPTVSVAMATFNGERFLQEQLDSLARQTLLPCELAVCDDGSTDGTLDILHMFAAKAPFPVRIFQNEKRMFHAPTFFRAASSCSGVLIAFCDQDDVWLPEKLQRCAEVISQTGSVALVHAGEVVNEKLEPLGIRTPAADRLTVLDAGASTGWRSFGLRLAMSPGFACVFRSSLLKQVPPVPPLSGRRVGHEQWLFFAAEVVGRIALIPDALVLYRQHGRNAKGFHTRPDEGSWPIFKVGAADYRREAEDAAARAQLLAGEVAARWPDLRSRMARAQRWYEKRAESLQRRAALYAEASWAHGMARLLSLICAGDYRAVDLGGLGLRSLAKDLVVPFLLRTREERGQATGACG